MWCWFGPPSPAHVGCHAGHHGKAAIADPASRGGLDDGKQGREAAMGRGWYYAHGVGGFMAAILVTRFGMEHQQTNAS